jgi:ABC-type uncharacterized transport system auxiliary subunit
MIRMRTIALAGAATLAAGCSVLPEPPPAARIYPLRAAVETGAVMRPQAARVVSVAPPVMAAALSGAEIVWIKDGAIGFMERGVWPARAPDALQGLLMETLDRQGQVAAVVRAGDGARVDAEVRWSVEDFQIVEDAAGLNARFGADINLMESRSRRILASTRIDIAEPVGQRTAPQAAAALARAGQRGAVEIANWTAAQASKLPANAPAPAAAAAVAMPAQNQPLPR